MRTRNLLAYLAGLLGLLTCAWLAIAQEPAPFEHPPVPIGTKMYEITQVVITNEPSQLAYALQVGRVTRDGLEWEKGRQRVTINLDTGETRTDSGIFAQLDGQRADQFQAVLQDMRGLLVSVYAQDLDNGTQRANKTP